MSDAGAPSPSPLVRRLVRRPRRAPPDPPALRPRHYSPHAAGRPPRLPRRRFAPSAAGEKGAKGKHMRGSHDDMRMCPFPGCKKCPDDGLPCAANKTTKKFSDSAAAQHMKREHPEGS